MDKLFIYVLVLRDAHRVTVSVKIAQSKNFHGVSMHPHFLVHRIHSEKKLAYRTREIIDESKRGSRERVASMAKWKIACTEAVCRGLHYQERCRHRYFMELTGGGQIQRLRRRWKIALPLPFPPESVPLTYNTTERTLSRTAERNSDVV